MSKKITVIGSSNTDMVVKTLKIPKPGETIIGGEFFSAAGGKGANQAVAAARAGGSVNFITCVGNDMFGEKALKNFLDEEINIDNIVKNDSAPSGVALIFVGSSGENSIAVAPGANYQLMPQHIENTKADILSSEILLMQLEIPVATVEYAAKIANQANVKIIFNPAPAQKLSDDFLKNISVITPNETETEILTGLKITNDNSIIEAAHFLLEKGIDSVIITLGEKGAYVANRNFSNFIPSYKTEAVDTTAAGDVFNGALAVGLSEGMDIIKAVKFANAAAAISVRKLGAQSSAPFREEINNLFNTNTNWKKEVL